MTTHPRDCRADRLMPDQLVAVCSPRHADGRPPEGSRDLVRHVILHTTTRRDAWAEWLAGNDASGLQAAGEKWFGHFFMTIQAACEGQGVAVVPRLFVEGELQAGTLRILPNEVTSAAAYYFLYPASRTAEPKLLRFRDWIHHQVGLAEVPSYSSSHDLKS